LLICAKVACGANVALCAFSPRNMTRRFKMPCAPINIYITRSNHNHHLVALYIISQCPIYIYIYRIAYHISPHWSPVIRPIRDARHEARHLQPDFHDAIFLSMSTPPPSPENTPTATNNESTTQLHLPRGPPNWPPRGRCAFSSTRTQIGDPKMAIFFRAASGGVPAPSALLGLPCPVRCPPGQADPTLPCPVRRGSLTLPLEICPPLGSCRAGYLQQLRPCWS
jgi:hypothetical protein